MCRHSSSNAKALERRQRGLDARGNNPANTRAESNWAVETLKNLDKEAVRLVSEDLKKINDHAQQLEGLVDPEAGYIPGIRRKFNNGCEKFFGKHLDGEPNPRDLISLMVEEEYGFKRATDAVKSDLEKKYPDLYKEGKGKEFKDRGRVEGPRRKDSASNPHGGITDRFYRDAASREFFDTKVEHAKGMFEGQPDSETYKAFLGQDAPFIAGASGTMHGLVMRLELERRERVAAKKEQPDDQQAKRQREKLIAVYMARLVGGGHHSVSECLIAAKGYGYFDEITHPLDDYQQAMQQLSVRLRDLGLPDDLTVQTQIGPGEPWREALARISDDVDKLGRAISDSYKRRELDASPLIAKFNNTVKAVIKGAFPDELANKLDRMPGANDDTRGNLAAEARDLIKQLQSNLGNQFIKDLDTNPFVLLSIRETLSGTLNLLSKNVVGAAPRVSSEPPPGP